jgi:peptidoglycan/xylan/chitin deacetylase (PgdA/CDA1 family)
MSDSVLRSVLISDFNIANLAGHLANDPETPVVEAVVAPFGQAIPVLMDGDPEIWRGDPSFAVVWTRPEGVIESFHRYARHEQDDGYAECATLARPILLKQGVPATFFVTTDLIDNRTMFHRNKASLCIETARGLPDREASDFLRDLGRRIGRPLIDREAFRRWILGLAPHEQARIDEACAILRIDVPEYLRERRPYLGSDQIRRLVADGFTIGAHARRHVPLGSLGEPAAEDEIVTSCRTIRQLSGRVPGPFAFPHSADGVGRAFLRRVVAAHPFVGRLFDTHQLRRDDAIILNRITADAPPVDPRSSNLPRLLHEAYLEEASESLRRLIATHPRRPSPGGNTETPGEDGESGGR